MAAVLQAQQIVNLAVNIAKAPGYTSLGGQLLNVVLEELCNTYDFDINRATFTFNFNSGVGSGFGPYTLPTNYMRLMNDAIFYVVNNQPYKMIGIKITEYDSFDKDPGLNGYPTYYSVDTSTTPYTIFFWISPSGSFPVTIRYYQLQTPITTPETSSVVPWFQSSQYLIQRVAGELMAVTDDSRALEYLGDGSQDKPGKAARTLQKFLEMKDDPENLVETVKLDKRSFRTTKAFGELPNTKIVGF